MTGETRHEQRQRARSRLAMAFGALVLAVAAIWLIWGFRWPPTAEVVVDGAAEPYEEPLPASPAMKQE